MKKEIFIALNNFEKPNALAIYGTHLAKQLDRFAFLFGVTKVPINTTPIVVNDAALTSSIAEEMNTVQARTEKKLQAISLDTEKIYPHVYYDTGIGFNEPTIISKTKKEDPYLMLVEGSSELTTLHEWFGTYETRLAENTEVPTLVVPENFEWKPVKNILYIMDLDDEKVNNMRFLSDLSKELNAKLTVVTLTDGNINDDDQKYINVTNTLRELLGYTDVPFHRIFANDPSDTVEKLVAETEANWLAFEHKSHSFLERVLDDYNTKHLILQSDKPVLVL